MYRKKNKYLPPRSEDVRGYLQELVKKLNNEFTAIERSYETVDRRVVEVRSIIGKASKEIIETTDVKSFRHITDKDGSIKFSAVVKDDKLRVDKNLGISIVFDSSTRKITIGIVENEIDHTKLQNVGTYTHAQIDNHIDDSTIHFTEASIDHKNIQNIGTKTHDEIDAHIDDKTNPHEVTKTQVGLGNVLDVLQVENAGSTPAILADTIINRPSAGVVGRVFISTDEQIIYRDTGVVWSKIGIVKWGDIDNKPTTFPPSTHDNTAHDPNFATESDLTTHTGDTTNPHSVTKTQVGLNNVDNVQQAAKTDFDTHVADKENPHEVTAAQVGAEPTGEVSSALDEIVTYVPLIEETDDYIVFVVGEGGVVLKPTWLNVLIIEALNPKDHLDTLPYDGYGYYDDIAFWTNVEKFGAKYLDEILTYFTFVSSVDGIVIDEDYTRVEIAAAVHGGYFDDIDLWTSIKFGVEE